MTDEQIAAYVNAQAIATNARIQGMIAENQIRESEGKAIAYDGAAFFNEAEQLDALTRHLIG